MLHKAGVNFRMFLPHNLHAKILLAKCEENYYVLTGSGNFAKNARIEQYNFVNNKELFYFYLNNIEELETKKSS